MPMARIGQAGMDDVGGIQDWYDSIPIITRFWFTGALAATALGNFKVVSVARLVWDFNAVKNQFEIWRIVSACLYLGPFAFFTAMRLYMLIQYSRQYESGGPYNTGAGGGTADYAFMMIFGLVMCLLAAPLLGSFLFSHQLIFYVLYIWSKRQPTAPVNIWGVPLKAANLPFVALGMSVFTGEDYTPVLSGIAFGHMYYFLVDVVPIVYGKDYIHTPQFLIDYFGIGEYNVSSAPPTASGPGRPAEGSWSNPGRVNPPNDPAAPGPTRSHNWGGGQSLGAN